MLKTLQKISIKLQIRSPLRSLSLPQEILNQEVPEKVKMEYHHFENL